LLSPVSFWRRICATLAIGAVVGLWVTRIRPDTGDALWLYVPLALAAVAVHIDRILPQVFVRAALWVELGLAAFAAVLVGDKTMGAVAGLSGVALLVLGSAPLSTENVRRQFAPIGYRRMFIFACVTLMASSYMLAIAGWDWMFSFMFPHRRAGLASFVEGALLLASVVGVLRMRGWGVLTAVVASVAGAAAFLVAAVPSARGLLGVSVYDHVAVRWLFGIAAGSAFLMVSPIVVSWVFPARPSAANDPPRAAWLHAALVVVALAVTAAGVVNGGTLRFD
jgi:hypothetical protein